MFRKALIMLTVGCLAVGLVACNTVRGAGKDLESAANATSNAINK